MQFIDFYKKQSVITDPGTYAYLFDSLPSSISAIKEIIQGLILHFWDGPVCGYKIAPSRLLEIETRYVTTMLEIIMQKDDRALHFSRPPEMRIVGSCRDFAVLFCSILRHHGIAARTRVAFSAFYFNDYFHDEVILEYWNHALGRWCLVDPRVTKLHIQRRNLTVTFDLLDVPRDQLIVAGLAWKMARQDKYCVDKFCGGKPNLYKGLWYIRDRLIQDVAALNSVEMQLWDVWGMMLHPHCINKDKNQLQLLDALADLTLSADCNHERILEVYASAELKVTEKIVSHSPIYKPRLVDIRGSDTCG